MFSIMTNSSFVISDKTNLSEQGAVLGLVSVAAFSYKRYASLINLWLCQVYVVPPGYVKIAEQVGLKII